MINKITNFTQNLDLFKLPLQGELLIEASAGTGKTYTIVAIYLRLLLGLGCNSVFKRPMKVEELLIVTFTEAATKELRCRIRLNIHELRIACLRNRYYTNNKLYVQFMEEIKDKNMAAKLLLLAERHMDKAAVFTIHSFCQRMLHLNAIESGIFFKQQLISDEFELRNQACEYFWRNYVSTLPLDIAAEVYKQWKGPEELLKTIERYLQGDTPVIKFSSIALENETLISRHKKILNIIADIKQYWYETVDDISAIIEKSDIDRLKFNRSNQAKWITKINSWVQEKNSGYKLPNVLKNFSRSFLTACTKVPGIVPEHPLFNAIEDLIIKPLTLNDLIINKAIAMIKETVAREKNSSCVLGFDDLLSKLDFILGINKTVVASIRNKFPVAIIDEFQDTDQQQYRIFKRIWHKQPKTALILIGDPKQAIYSFRGADIFTYLKARLEINTHYTLNTNWRSTPGIVHSINTLFQRIKHSFIFPEIQFLPVKAADKNNTLRFEYNGKNQPALNIWLMDGKRCSIGEYQSFMAKYCATQIYDLLFAGQKGKALLWNGEYSQQVKASDITVLVRNHKEASLIRESLNLLKISSVYLSNRDNVFETLEAQDILRILQAILALAPERKNKLRNALASSIFGLNALDIEALNTNSVYFNAIIKEFEGYLNIWKKNCVMVMLRKLMATRKLAENILATTGGKRRLTNILHICELLQEEESKLDSKHALMRWLAQNIAKPNRSVASQQIRLEKDNNLVRIVTIHKSKGLEYPLVWLPFIANFRVKNNIYPLYHDKDSFKAILDLSNNNESIELAEKERLAEDLRLLYVALTRSIWHCSLGIAPICRNKCEKTGYSDFHKSALGLLIQQGKQKDAVGLQQCLQNLCNDNNNINWQISATCYDTYTNKNNLRFDIEEPLISISELKAKKVMRSITNDWSIISYDSLKQHHYINKNKIINILPSIKNVNIGNITEQSKLTLHNFPSDAFAKNFLHSFFENLDFTKSVSADFVLNKLQHSCYNICWQLVLTEWISAILQVPLNKQGLKLSKLSEKDKKINFEFYIPINKQLTAAKLDACIRSYDMISSQCPKLDFMILSGMLKGIIDLVFRNNGRYYLLEYKYNWLGENCESYTQQAIKQAIMENRYDIEYQLYSLALHRYLVHRMHNYSYEKHFGSVIYLFLRGINSSNPNFGVFTTRPKKTLIEQMDLLFSNS